MLTPCTKDEHVFSAWIIGTVCQCGATEVRFKPELGAVRAEPRALADPKPEVVVHATDAAPVAMEEAAHEPERTPEAEEALPPRRRR